MKKTETEEKHKSQGLSKKTDQYLTVAIVIGALLILGMVLLNIDVLW